MPDTIDLADLGTYLDGIAADFDTADTTPALEATAEDLDALHRRRFATETGADGVPWPPWQWRAPWAPEEHRTLEVTSRLLASMRRGGSEHVESIGPGELTYGTAVPYAATHQHGATVTTTVPLVPRSGAGYLRRGTRLRIPARPFAGWDAETADKAAGHVADSLVDAMRGG